MAYAYKYFILSDKPRPFSSDLGSSLLRWEPDSEVSLDENVEFRPYLSVDIDKLKNKTFSPPKSGEFQKVKPILQELFQDYYSIFLRIISETDFLDDDEYYEQNHHLGFYEIQYFAGSKNTRNELRLRFTNDLKFFSISLSRSKGYSFRPSWRKNGIPINKEKFLQYFNLTMQFLSDPNSFLVFLDDYMLNFRKLIDGDNTFAGFIISAEQSISKILQQLEVRKLFIEDRLIKNDTDTQLARSQLRGELNGILYAIKTVKEST